MRSTQSLLRSFIILLFLLPPVITYGQQRYSVYGMVADGTTQMRLPAAKVELIVQRRSAVSQTTGADGYFNLYYAGKADTFQVRVSLKGYGIYTSPASILSTVNMENPMGTIYLTRLRPDTIKTTEFISQKLRSLNYLPTKGSYTLFYAMNPELRNKTEVPVNYSINYAELPKFKPVRRNFRKRFKKDKKRDEPYLYTTIRNDFDYESRGRIGYRTSLVLQSGVPISTETNDPEPVACPPLYYAGKVKKFVFVFFKLDAGGKPVFLEYRYSVHYYTENVRGDESLYNKTSNATYGYAPMKAKIYQVEVFDQLDNNRRVRVSDDQVDPAVYFERNELYNKWIKIPIQVYD